MFPFLIPVGLSRLFHSKTVKTRLIVSGDPKNDQDVFTPVWKSNDEICYENLSTSKGGWYGGIVFIEKRQV